MSVPGPSAPSPSLTPGSPGLSTGRSKSPRTQNDLGKLYPTPGNSEIERWFKSFSFSAKDLLSNSEFVEIHGDQKVEAATKLMLAKEVSCLAVYETTPSGSKNYVGLFDYADLNAFLLLAVQTSRSTFDDSRVKEIIARAKEGGDASVSLACDLSGKNPLVTVPPNADLLALLTVFSRGTHRVLVADDEADTVHGIVEDYQLLQWFNQHANEHGHLVTAISSPLCNISIMPSISTPRLVVSCSSDDSILDAMDLMSTEGVNSAAVVDLTTGALLSAVSVTDIGKVVAPSEDKNVIYAPLSQLVTRIKEPYGATDGEERYPVFSVSATDTLDYTIQKLLATHAHRVFITQDPSASPSLTASLSSGNLRGVVSVIDVLSVFARLGNIPDVDPASMSKHRRANSMSSTSSGTSSRSRTATVPIAMGSPRFGSEHGHRRGSSTLFVGDASLSLPGAGLASGKSRSGSMSKGEGLGLGLGSLTNR